MKYETVQTLKDEEFKRSTGVQRSTFDEMLKVVEAGIRDFGRPPKLGRADQLLLTLMYWREYRTEFHIGLSYGVSESTVCRTIQKVEDVLIKSKQFHIPGKKVLQSSDTVGLFLNSEKTGTFRENFARSMPSDPRNSR
jgi:hypothetical protein